MGRRAIQQRPHRRDNVLQRRVGSRHPDCTSVPAPSSRASATYLHALANETRSPPRGRRRRRERILVVAAANRAGTLLVSHARLGEGRFRRESAGLVGPIVRPHVPAEHVRPSDRRVRERGRRQIDEAGRAGWPVQATEAAPPSRQGGRILPRRDRGVRLTQRTGPHLARPPAPRRRDLLHRHPGPSRRRHTPPPMSCRSILGSSPSTRSCRSSTSANERTGRRAAGRYG